MDLQQRKLNKSEWESIEVPVASDEMEILHLIMKGYHHVNIKYNKAESLFSYLKMEQAKDMEDYLYNKYFSEKVDSIVEKYKITSLQIQTQSKPVIKKADLIRLQKNTVESLQKANVYEYIIMDVMEKILKYKKTNDKKWMMYYYTLYKLIRNHVSHINTHIMQLSEQLLRFLEEKMNTVELIQNASEFIEKNDILNHYSDMMLYQHQKEIFTVCKQERPKLILYIAPTGTGKTMTPIGLSEQHRVIFVCAARHVGLALARAAISVNKKIAFAFGCGSSAEIRLHYFAAKEITRNRHTGGIWKVDNTVGDKVEIMICDIKSYIPAMYYMLAFNTDTEIITYWDEPTITMDYDDHEFHDIIQKNWSENKIPNMVLSSATLPKLHELGETIADFKNKFPDASVCNIVSHDCRKSIPIVNKNGFVVLPHCLYREYAKMKEVVEHCLQNLTLLRYFDLKELVGFVDYAVRQGLLSRANQIERFFETLDDVNIVNIKLYYLNLLNDISEGDWSHVYDYFMSMRVRMIETNDYIDTKGNKIVKSASLGPGIVLQGCNRDDKTMLRRMASEQILPSTTTTASIPMKTQNQEGTCGIYVTTKDAFTLTDGPTIFLATDVEKVAKFCVQQANIPLKVMEDISQKINYNNTINQKIAELEKSIEDAQENDQKQGACDFSGDKKKKLHKLERSLDEKSGSGGGGKDLKRLMNEMDMLRAMIKITKLNETFVPNTSMHLKKWAEEFKSESAFKSDIDDETIVKIMLLTNVADSWKVLLLMGIGVFTNHESIEYTEIMKHLADQQKLYLIIASSDYIYGTNYQFCHGYISKDATMTQEKIIQSMGRIGRNKIQQNYSIRFRDDEQIMKVFTNDVEKPEVRNMNRLFCSQTSSSNE